MTDTPRSILLELIAECEAWFESASGIELARRMGSGWTHSERAKVERWKAALQNEGETA